MEILNILSNISLDLISLFTASSQILQISKSSSSLLLFVGVFIALMLLALLLIIILKVHVNQAMLKTEQSERRFEKLYSEVSAIFS